MNENPFAKQKKKKFKKSKNSKRNLPNELNENEGKKININAKAFVPKNKAHADNGNKPYYPPQYINRMNNINNINNINNYYTQPYYPNNIYQAQNNNSDIIKQYMKEFQLGYMKRGLNEYNKNQNSQINPFSKSNITSDHPKEVNNRARCLKITSNSFIPKSMREYINKPSEDAITQNEALKKKEEEIKKMKEKEKEKEKEEKENIKNEEKNEDQKSNKESEKEEDQKEEKKDKANGENSNEQKKKSNLFKLLESMEDKSQKK